LEITKTCIKTIINIKLNISDYCAQLYDTVKNMSGCYSDFQAQIKNINPLTLYISYAAHSFNLVVSYAVACYNETVTFLGLI